MNINRRGLGRITKNVRQSFIKYGGVRINGIGVRNNIKGPCFNEGELESSSLEDGFRIVKRKRESKMAVKFRQRRREYMMETNDQFIMKSKNRKIKGRMVFGYFSRVPFLRSSEVIFVGLMFKDQSDDRPFDGLAFFNVYCSPPRRPWCWYCPHLAPLLYQPELPLNC